MGLLGRIVGGAVEGLGQGLTREAERKKEVDGLELRHKYQMKHLSATQDFAAEQGQLGRDHATSTAETGMEFRAEESKKNRDAAATEQKANRTQRLDIHNKRMEVESERIKAQLQYQEGMSERDKARLALSIAQAETRRKELEAKGAPTKNKNMSEDEVYKWAEKLAYVYKDDEDGKRVLVMDEEGDPEIDPEKRDFYANFKLEHGVFPSQYKLTVGHLRKAMQSNSIDLSQVIENINEAGNFGVSESLALRAIKDPEIMSLNRRYSSEPSTVSRNQMGR